MMMEIARVIEYLQKKNHIQTMNHYKIRIDIRGSKLQRIEPPKSYETKVSSANAGGKVLDIFPAGCWSCFVSVVSHYATFLFLNGTLYSMHFYFGSM